MMFEVSKKANQRIKELLTKKDDVRPIRIMLAKAS